MKRRGILLTSFLVFCYAFLYLPIVIVVAFSFNKSKQISIWSGFSWDWYWKLAQNEAILKATWMSLKIACFSASMAVVLGTLAAVILVRFGPFRGRTLFQGLLTAPLVMPDIITGLALLLLFVGMDQLIGWPHGRGITTVIIAHLTLSIAYVTVLVQARLMDFDQSIEEAALDLGAHPAKVFFVITLPIIMPALAGGWLLAFALSFDDVVIASFLSGPDSTTLPMVIYSSLKQGISPEINALATLIVFLLTLGVIGASIAIYRASKTNNS